MAKKFFRKSLIVICLGLLLCQPVCAKETKQEETKTEVQVENTQDIKEIRDEEVPLGLETKASFEKYKRDAVVLVVFGGLLVSTTVIALAKEKYERKKYN